MRPRYQRTPGKLTGCGIAQLVRDIERAFMAALRDALENVSFGVAYLARTITDVSSAMSPMTRLAT